MMAEIDEEQKLGVETVMDIENKQKTLRKYEEYYAHLVQEKEYQNSLLYQETFKVKQQLYNALNTKLRQPDVHVDQAILQEIQAYRYMKEEQIKTIENLSGQLASKGLSMSANQGKMVETRQKLAKNEREYKIMKPYVNSQSYRANVQLPHYCKLYIEQIRALYDTKIKQRKSLQLQKLKIDRSIDELKDSIEIKTKRKQELLQTLKQLQHEQ